MKLKYYLRGLGVGIAVTALLLGLSGKKESLTDAEIMARARELGMTENTVLAELETEEVPQTEEVPETVPAEEEAESEETDTVIEEATVSSEAEMETEGTAEVSETEALENTESSQEAAPEKAEETAKAEEEPEEEREIIRITVRSGETSWPVAQRVQEAGLVSDAAAFDDFLCDNGYSRYLRAGEYDIPAGSTQEEIARILARK